MREVQYIAIKSQIKATFASIFFFGIDDYPVFSDQNKAILNTALSAFDDNLLREAPENVSEALNVISHLPPTARSERIAQIEVDLKCMQNWLDIYPWDLIANHERQ